MFLVYEQDGEIDFSELEDLGSRAKFNTSDFVSQLPAMQRPLACNMFVAQNENNPK